MGARHRSRVTLAIDQIDRKVKTHNGHTEIIEYLTGLNMNRLEETQTA